LKAPLLERLGEVPFLEQLMKTPFLERLGEEAKEAARLILGRA